MTRLLPLAALALMACGEPKDTNDGFTTTQTTGTTEGLCEVLSDEVIAQDVQAGQPLNFSADNALAELSGVTNTTNVFTYPDETTINVEVEFVYDGGEVHFIQRDAVGVMTQQELLRCFTALSIPGTLHFTTGDGSFDEVIPAILEAKKRREGVVFLEIAQADLVGTWVPEDSGLDAALTGLTLDFEGDITNLGSSGVLDAIKGDDLYEVGIWAPPPTQGR